MTDAPKSRALVPIQACPEFAIFRETHPHGEPVYEHRHDHVTLTIPLVGGFNAFSDIGDAVMEGASAVLHPNGRAHAAAIWETGLEAVGIHIDPAALRRAGLRQMTDRTFYWRGGAVGAAARRLARVALRSVAADGAVARSTLDFLRFAEAHPLPSLPSWLDRADAMMRARPQSSIREIARRLDLHPSWFCQAYRSAKGEGAGEYMQRKRIEGALVRLRTSTDPLAQIAIDAGFCDQSHMNRAFRSMLNLTPLQVRSVPSDL